MVVVPIPPAAAIAVSIVANTHSCRRSDRANVSTRGHAAGSHAGTHADGTHLYACARTLG